MHGTAQPATPVVARKKTGCAGAFVDARKPSHSAPGAVAQSRERRPCTAEIRDSSPLGSARSRTRPQQRFTVVNCRGARSTCCSAALGTRNLPHDRRGHPGLANSRACLSEAAHDPLLHFLETSEEKLPSPLSKVRPIQRQRIPPQSSRAKVNSKVLDFVQFGGATGECAVKPRGVADDPGVQACRQRGWAQRGVCLER